MNANATYRAGVLVLSSALAVLGVVQLVRAAVTGAGPFAYVVGAILLAAGGLRLALWWRGRSRGPDG